MNRDEAIAELRDTREPWDFLVIGGGATGLGVAVDAASRGYRTVLVEQHDFAKGTSSRSTKLIHGGVRYLKQGNVPLVLGALRERGLLCENAPHLVHPLEFVIPIYRLWEGPFYGIGMKIYDRLAGKLGLASSEILSRAETLARLPTLAARGLRGGVSYSDGQFDDARLAVSLMRTIFDHGGIAVNYMQVVRLPKKNGVVTGAIVEDVERGGEIEIRARAVINATGVFSDGVRKMDEARCEPVITASQGAHMVLPKEFLPGSTALMVPHTSDGRVMFAVPWHGRVIVGTTDVPVSRIDLEPAPMEEEIEFLLTTASKYLSKRPARADVLSAYAGLRPLVRSGDVKNTAALSRDHTILTSKSGLLTIAGGKWTTYRKMAAEAVDEAERAMELERRPCVTKHLRIHGSSDRPAVRAGLAVYGTDAARVEDIIASDARLGARLHPALPYLRAEVVWAARHEMARTVEDVLARRTRALLLDATASAEAAGEVGALMAPELGKDSGWERQQVAEFRKLARRYLVS